MTDVTARFVRMGLPSGNDQGGEGVTDVPTSFIRMGLLHHQVPLKTYVSVFRSRREGVEKSSAYLRCHVVDRYNAACGASFHAYAEQKQRQNKWSEREGGRCVTSKPCSAEIP